MGYIVCEECGDYYKLQNGEHPEDFSRCHCGGKINYKLRMNPDKNNSPSYKSGFKLPSLSESLKILGLLAAGVILLMVKFLPEIVGALTSLNSNPSSTGYPSIMYPVIIIITLTITILATQLDGHIRR